MGAAPSSGVDPEQIRELLATAQGYAVLGRDGKRVGAFIELAGSGGERIAIRHDGVLIWRRRLLPITTVASVVPERRAVVLNVDRRLLSSTVAASDALARTPPSAEEAAGGQWQTRVARYVSAREAEADEAGGDRADPANKQPAERAGPERPPTPESAELDQRNAARHLLFVSTSRGYVLIEQEGPTPPLGQGIAVPEQPGSFRVAKLARSPLPNDPRICAYLEQTE